MKKKAARQAAMIKVIESQEIETQEDLAATLRDKPAPPSDAPAEGKQDQTAELAKQPDAARITPTPPAVTCVNVVV